MGIFWTIVIWAAIIWLKSAYDKGQLTIGLEARRRRAERTHQLVLEGFGKLLGFISKADGRISEVEVNVASKCLRTLGLTEDEYQVCVRAFNSVRGYTYDAFSSYAAQFASLVTHEARILIYEMLWSVAGADGILDPKENEVLRRAPGALRIDPTLYVYFWKMHFGNGGGGNGGSGSGGSSSAPRPEESELDKAYARLGCAASDSDAAIRSAYRKLAMRYHPDRLKAEGVPDALVAQATRSMAEINAAWEVVRKHRHL